ncbi:MAG: VanW family protein, partial [Eubacteriales bacterium]|nr:VanW family protein [Eubacteriales bacterium]
VYLGVFDNGRIHVGIYINEVHVGGLTEEKASDVLRGEFVSNVSGQTITLSSDLGSKSFTLADIGFDYDFERAIAEALKIGRTGNIFGRAKAIMNAKKDFVKIDLKMSYDSDKLKEIVDGYCDTYKTDLVQPSYAVEGDKLTINSGHPGESIDSQLAFSMVSSALKAGYYGKVELDTKIERTDLLDAYEVYEAAAKEPSNASFSVSYKQVDIVTEKDGLDIEMSELVRFITNNQKIPDSSNTLELDHIAPDITAAQLRKKLFRDTLSSYSAKSSPEEAAEANRSTNVRLATAAVNGTVVAPGSTFSFNQTVGDRTAAKGYKPARVYIAYSGTVSEALGGGICQVSTAIYNAVLYADLSVVERNSHVFTVDYAPLGFDAAVSYGVEDLKFKNTTDWPIRIDASYTSDGIVKVTLVGFDSNPYKSIELTSKIVETIEFDEIVSRDPSMQPGESIITQKGQNGYVVDAYVISKYEGAEIGRKVLHRTSYISLAQIERKGPDIEETLPDGAEPADPTDPESTQPNAEPGMPSGTTEPGAAVTPPETTAPSQTTTPAGTAEP